MERHLFYRAEWSQCGLSIRAAQIAWVRQQYSYSVVYCGFANDIMVRSPAVFLRRLIVIDTRG